MVNVPAARVRAALPEGRAGASYRHADHSRNPLGEVTRATGSRHADAAQGRPELCCPDAAATPTTCRCRPARLHAHVIRSPHPHADIVRIDASAALAHDGVWAVITGEDVRKLSDPFLVALKSPVHQWSLAVERVRYVGEPVALVVAESRYLAEDAAELVEIDYEPREAVIDPLVARESSAPLLHRRGQDQRDFGPQVQVRRHRGRVRAGRQGRVADHPLPPALVHADGMLRRGRRIQSGRTTATTCWRTSRGRSAPIR